MNSIFFKKGLQNYKNYGIKETSNKYLSIIVYQLVNCYILLCGVIYQLVNNECLGDVIYFTWYELMSTVKFN